MAASGSGAAVPLPANAAAPRWKLTGEDLLEIDALIA